MTETPATILVCDDDRLVLATLVHGLKTAGYRVIEADNGDDAILLARQWRPDLALLDMRMNGKSGLDVAAYLRDHIGTPFMFLSAFNEESIIREAMGLGAKAYLVKPLDVRQIVPAVERALGLNPPEDAPGGLESSGVREIQSVPEAVSAESRLGFGARVDLLQPVRDIASDAELRAMAIGVLMERHRLDVKGARQRLDALTSDWGENLDGAAARIVAATEALSAPASPRR